MAIATNLLTKGTVVKYTDDIPSDNYAVEMHNALDAKALEMAAEDKTDALVYPDYATLEVRREWVDEAAAQEWKAFVEQCAVTYTVGVDSITIFSL